MERLALDIYKSGFQLKRASEAPSLAEGKGGIPPTPYQSSGHGRHCVARGVVIAINGVCIKHKVVGLGRNGVRLIHNSEAAGPQRHYGALAAQVGATVGAAWGYTEFAVVVGDGPV